MIYSDAVNRTSWGPRGLNAWYCGPAMYHYRCTHFFVPETGAMRVSGLYDLFPQHYIMPTFTREEHTTAVNNELQEAIFGLNKKAKKHLLKAMSTSMATMTATINVSPQSMDNPPHLRGCATRSEGGTSPISHHDNQPHGIRDSSHRTENISAHDKAHHTRHHGSNRTTSY